MGAWRVGTLVAFVLYLLIPNIQGRFINFKPGYEYVYSFNGHSTVNDVGKFVVQAKVGYTNIQQRAEGQELLLKVHTFNLAPENDPTVKGADYDFSKWFSFVISPRGEITHVYHPAGEDEEVIVSKKGFAALFASRLHEEGEVPGKVGNEGFTYHITEHGHEGEHNATYTVAPSQEGVKFTKVRHGHPVQYARANYSKTMHYHDFLGTIHSVLIDESFKSPTTPPGFDPHAGMRKIKAVNEFSTMAYPEMAYVSQGNLHFLTRHVDKQEWRKPNKNMLTVSIKLGNIKPRRKYLNVTEARKEIVGNLTCMENQPDQGAPAQTVCFRKIVDVLEILPDEEIINIAHFYFTKLQPTVAKYRIATENMIDAYGVLATELAEKLLAEKIFLSPNPNHDFVKRVLTHVVSNDKPPSEFLLQTLEDAVFHKDKFPPQFYIQDTQSRCMLALGSVSNKLRKHGNPERARRNVDKVHELLGYHDPWLYRKRRETMDPFEKEKHDHYKVVLLETLGNARLDHSYDYIVSHINSTNSPWVKRAGCHALRKYEHDHAAETLLYAAIYDEEQSVRYEASLLYMAHPRGKMIAPFDNRIPHEGNASYVADDPYDNGVGVMDLAQHNAGRSRRSIWDGLYFRLEAPSVDWRKLLGSTDIGASFGVIMMNLLDLSIGMEAIL